jgi:hypothetical protein
MEFGEFGHEGMNLQEIVMEDGNRSFKTSDVWVFLDEF